MPETSVLDALSAAPWWFTSLAVIGGVATVGVIIGLFSTLGRRPVTDKAEDPPEVGSDDFLRAFAGSSGSCSGTGGSARLLNNGDAFFPVILEAIGAAEHSVNFMVYIWEPGRSSDQVIAALIERARAGVEVRVLLDAMGGLRAPDDDFERFRAAGGHVVRYRPARFGKLTRLYKRNHRRAIVIDGRVGFTGGAAVGDKWLGDARNPEEWRDSMVELRGAPAQALQSAFVQLWANTCGEILTGDAFWPDVRASETASDTASDAGDTIERYAHVLSSPGSEDHPLRHAFVLSYLAARETLYITTPYFVPDRSTRRAVMERARAGVDVRILLPNNHTDAKPIRLASHRFYEALLRSGVRVYEYQPTMIHTKHAVIDGRWSLLGSPNMDVRSYELNDENVMGLLDVELGAECVRTFLADIEQAIEIDLATWRRRSLFKRILERVASLPAEQY
ncbi:MAG: phosphatidylserine/phosphatidylglycerophosphate/cardiolipin synthase family protein [Gemmatimonadota bacterium]